MLEDTGMEGLQQFHQRYPSKPKDHRVMIIHTVELRDNVDSLRTEEEQRGVV